MSVIDDADVPLLFALLIAAAVAASPNVRSIMTMAATSAAIGFTAHGAVALVRRARRARRRALGSRVT